MNEWSTLLTNNPKLLPMLMDGYVQCCLVRSFTAADVGNVLFIQCNYRMRREQFTNDLLTCCIWYLALLSTSCFRTTSTARW